MADTSDDEPIAKKRRVQPMRTAERYDAIARHRLKTETAYQNNANNKAEDVEQPSSHQRNPITEPKDQTPEDSQLPSFPTEKFYHFETTQQRTQTSLNEPKQAQMILN